MWRKKTEIPQGQLTKTSCDPFQQKWKQAGWALQNRNQYLQSQALVFPRSHFSIHCILLRSARKSSKPPQCCWSGDGSASIQPGQKTQRRISLSPIWNHKPSPTPPSPVKKLKIHQKITFVLKFISCKRNYLTTTKLSIFLLVAVSCLLT